MFANRSVIEAKGGGIGHLARVGNEGGKKDRVLREPDAMDLGIRRAGSLSAKGLHLFTADGWSARRKIATRVIFRADVSHIANARHSPNKPGNAIGDRVVVREVEEVGSPIFNHHLYLKFIVVNVN